MCRECVPEPESECHQRSRPRAIWTKQHPPRKVNINPKKALAGRYPRAQRTRENKFLSPLRSRSPAWRNGRCQILKALELFVTLLDPCWRDNCLERTSPPGPVPLRQVRQAPDDESVLRRLLRHAPSEQAMQRSIPIVLCPLELKRNVFYHALLLILLEVDPTAPDHKMPSSRLPQPSPTTRCPQVAYPVRCADPGVNAELQ